MQVFPDLLFSVFAGAASVRNRGTFDFAVLRRSPIRLFHWKKFSKKIATDRAGHRGAAQTRLEQSHILFIKKHACPMCAGSRHTGQVAKTSLSDNRARGENVAEQLSLSQFNHIRFDDVHHEEWSDWHAQNLFCDLVNLGRRSQPIVQTARLHLCMGRKTGRGQIRCNPCIRWLPSGIEPKMAAQRGHGFRSRPRGLDDFDNWVHFGRTEAVHVAKPVQRQRRRCLR